jgi:hypothetical protein
MKVFRKCEAEITPFRIKRAAELLELICEFRRSTALKDINLVRYFYLLLLFLVG